MDNKAILIICSMALLLVLTGCTGSDSGLSSLFNSAGINIASSGGGDGGSGDGGTGAGSAHSPEPMTIALMGGGLVAYALLRRRRR